MGKKHGGGGGGNPPKTGISVAHNVTAVPEAASWRRKGVGIIADLAIGAIAAFAAAWMGDKLDQWENNQQAKAKGGSTPVAPTGNDPMDNCTEDQVRGWIRQSIDEVGSDGASKDHQKVSQAFLGHNPEFKGYKALGGWVAEELKAVREEAS